LVDRIPPSLPDIESSIAVAKETWEKADDRARSAQILANKTAVEATTAEAILEQAEKALKQLAEAPPLAMAELEMAAFNDRRAGIVDERAAAADALNDALGTRSKLTAQAARAEERLDGFTHQRDAGQARLHQAKQQLKESFQVGIPRDAARVIAARQSDLRSARQAEEAARAAFDQVRQAHDKIQQSNKQLDRELAKLKQASAEQRGILSQLAPDHEPKRVDSTTVRQLTMFDEITILGDWIRAAQTDYARQRSAEEDARTTSVADLMRAANAMGISFASTEPAKVRALAQSSATDALLAKQHTANKVTDLEAKLVRRKTLESEIAKTRTRAGLYRTLADELRQNRFIDFVLGESIQQLARLASSELRSISAERYSLSAEQSSFVIVDHANADETRSVATLSGGESFLASLSLAMALARSITDIAGEAIGSRLEAMFIDEGFGTLDVDTLDVVIDALERLRDSQRIVGVITHVSQLAERIPDGLVVERDGATSRIRPR
jgi:exonuclease SbcC